MSASRSVRLLRILARLHPELWELIHPHVPKLARVADRADAVSLNPQPLPPKALLAAAVDRGASAIADAAIAAHLSGRDAREILAEIGDDMCPTPPRPKIHWPRQWPLPWPPGEPYPIEPEVVGQAVQAQSALVFQAYADSVADEELSGAFADLAGRLADASLEGDLAGVGLDGRAPVA
jgi:hypothetical protein